MDIKVLLQALGRVWLIDEQHAYLYAELLQAIIEGKAGDIKAGLFDDSELPFRADSRASKAIDGEVLVIPVTGPMMENDFCGTLGTASMTKMINAANRDSSIQSLVLKMNTPGGTVAGTEDFAAAVAASQKPVVTFATLMCSAGYWVGSASDEIVLGGETSIAGSIGTMATLRDTRKSDEARGNKTLHVFASRSIHKNKAALEALDGKPEAYITEILDPLNAVFESAVTKNRGDKLDLKKEDVLTGKVYVGNNAVQAGLADKIGSLDYAVKRSLQLAKTLR